MREWSPYTEGSDTARTYDPRPYYMTIVTALCTQVPGLRLVVFVICCEDGGIMTGRQCEEFEETTTTSTRAMPRGNTL